MRHLLKMDWYSPHFFHAQESKKSAREKAASVAQQLREIKLSAVAQKVEESIEETLTYMDYTTEYWNRIRTHPTIERLNREIKRRKKRLERSLMVKVP